MSSPSRPGRYQESDAECVAATAKPADRLVRPGKRFGVMTARTCGPLIKDPAEAMPQDIQEEQSSAEHED